MQEVALTFIVGVGASVISGLVGSGGGAIRIPYLLFLGLPPQVAVGTGKFGAFGVTVGSLAKFRTTGHVRRDVALILTLVGLPAAYIGLQLLLSISDELITGIVALALLLTAGLLFLNQALGVQTRTPSVYSKITGYVADFFISIMKAGFSLGFGLLSLPVHMYFLGMTALEANATSKIPGLVKSALILTVVIASGIVSWYHAIALMLGSMAGSYLGAHIAIKQGNQFVKIAYSLLLVAMSIKLLVDLV